MKKRLRALGEATKIIYALRLLVKEIAGLLWQIVRAVAACYVLINLLPP